MGACLTYSEQRSAADLAPWVACFWQIRGNAVPARPHRVLPDGCADLLFDLEQARRSGPAPLLIGPMSGAQVFALSGRVDLMGLRLRPGTVDAFARVRADRLLDAIAPLAQMDSTLRVDLEQVARLATFAERIEFISAACRTALSAVKRPDALVRAALVRWAAAERAPLAAISVLTRDLGLSERAFERRFASVVGMTPVRYRRLARLRSVLRLHAGGIRDWATLAASTGFSDQSHLVRDCREFTGLTPTEWAASQADPAGFFQDGRITTF